MLAETVDVAVDIYKDVKATKDEIETLNEEISKNKDSYKLLHEFEKKVIEFQTKMITVDLNSLKSLGDNLKGKSQATLDYNKYLVTNSISYLKIEINKLLSAFEPKGDMMNTIMRTENAISTMINIYERIQAFTEQKSLTDYISDITQSETLFTIGIPPTYKVIIENMQKAILANIITERYKQAVEAFDYWSFPFYCEIALKLKEIKVISRDENFDATIRSYASNLNVLIDHLNNFDTMVIPSIDNNLHSLTFENETAFYTWTSPSHIVEIEKLLSGENATLYSDVSESNYDAIKFRTVYIRIEPTGTNLTVRKRLNELLNKLNVVLIHSGVSYYKFMGNTHVIDSNSNSGQKVLLSYQYGCVTSSQCENANESFKKFEKHKPLLSPYTFWQMRLEPIVPNHSKTLKQKPNQNQIFQDINSIIKSSGEQIVVSLCGKGQYVSNYVSNYCK